MRLLFLFIAVIVILLGCNSSKQEYDTIIRNGMIYDGNGAQPYKGDIEYYNTRSHLLAICQKLRQKMKLMQKAMRLLPALSI